MVIFKIGWSIRSWLSDYISFSFYKSYCSHDIYWILVAFMRAALALIKVTILYGLYRHLYTQLIYWHCAVILLFDYAHASHVSALELFAPDFMPVSTRQGVVTWIVYGYTCVGSDEEYIQARILHKLYGILLKLPIYHLNHSVKSNERLVIDSGPDYSMCDQWEITTAGLSTML